MKNTIKCDFFRKVKLADAKVRVRVMSKKIEVPSDVELSLSNFRDLGHNDEQEETETPKS